MPDLQTCIRKVVWRIRLEKHMKHYWTWVLMILRFILHWVSIAWSPKNMQMLWVISKKVILCVAVHLLLRGWRLQHLILESMIRHGKQQKQQLAWMLEPGMPGSCLQQFSWKTIITRQRRSILNIWCGRNPTKWNTCCSWQPVIYRMVKRKSWVR